QNTHPDLSLMSEVRDRLSQKQMLGEFKIPTASLVSFSDNDDLAAWLKVNKQGLVMKKRLFGYDGYGTVILRSVKDLENSKIQFLPDFWICEEFCAFKRE